MEQVKTTKDVQRVIEQSLKKNPSDRKRYFVAHLADGRQLNEHSCRWVDVPLHEIVMLELSMLRNKYQIERGNCPGFVEFIHFKTAERTLMTEGKTTSRCIGWTDGLAEFIIRIDEETGKRQDPEVTQLRQGHLHPQSKLLKKPSAIIIPQPTIMVGRNG